MRFKPLGKFVRRMAEYYWYYGASDSWRAIFSLLERNDGASLLDWDAVMAEFTKILEKTVNE